MKKQQNLSITPAVTIPISELSFTFSRSSGKGGQHVNKVNSRVSLYFDIESSTHLTPEQKSLVKQRLAGRINNRGVFRIDADRRRSQAGNRDDAVNRFVGLMQEGLYQKKNRKNTRPSRGAQKRRIQAKKQRSQLKKQRGKRNFSE